MMDFAAIRKEYENAGIDPQSLSDCPLKQLESWYQTAVERRPGEWFEPNSMALATCDKQQRVTVRIVLLKGIVSEGIRFFTNYDSDKGRQLLENPKCSVAFHWPYLGRQVRIEGIAEQTSREVSEDYFHSRPRGSQVGASVSQQSSKIESREFLANRRDQLLERLGGAAVPLPDSWGGYLIRPTRFEFWQGRQDRLHDRIVYQPENNGDSFKAWKTHRLSP